MTKGKKHFILIKIEQRAREIRCPITFVLMNVFTINALRIVCYKSIMCVCPFNKTQNTKTKEDNFLLYLIYYVCLSVFDWFGYFCLNVSRAGICGNYYFYFIIYIKCAPTCLMVSHIKKCMFSRSLFHTHWRNIDRVDPMQKERNNMIVYRYTNSTIDDESFQCDNKTFFLLTLP